MLLFEKMPGQLYITQKPDSTGVGLLIFSDALIRWPLISNTLLVNRDTHDFAPNCPSNRVLNAASSGVCSRKYHRRHK